MNRSFISVIAGGFGIEAGPTEDKGYGEHREINAEGADRVPAARASSTHDESEVPTFVSNMTFREGNMTCEMGTDNGRTSPRHVGESRQVQLMGDGHRLGRAVAVFGENEIRLSPARVVALERVRPVQQQHDVGVLLQ